MKQTIKKHKAKPVEKDFSALDSAVEELARHNAMLQSEIVLDDDSTKVSTDEEDDAEKITLTSESEVLQEIKDDDDTPASNAVGATRCVFR